MEATAKTVKNTLVAMAAKAFSKYKVAKAIAGAFTKQFAYIWYKLIAFCIAIWLHFQFINNTTMLSAIDAVMFDLYDYVFAKSVVTSIAINNIFVILYSV